MISTSTRIRRSLALRAGNVFFAHDFEHLASRGTVGQVLAALVRQGTLVRISRGIYARTKLSVWGDRHVPIEPVGVLAREALQRLGIAVLPLPVLAARRRIPSNVALVNIGSRRCSRRFAANGTVVWLLQGPATRPAR